MVAKEATEERMVSGIGGAAFVAWLLFLAPAGPVLLFGLAYAMVFQNLALGIICGLLLATPGILSTVWILLALFAALKSRWSSSQVPVAETAVDTATIE